MTITINAVNELVTGSAKIVKATTNGGSKAGWHFEVKNSSGTVIGNYVTDATGVIVLDLVPGTYTVTETDGAYKYWVNDPNPSRTVTVKADETATVTFTNQWRGQAQIIKTTTNGGTVAGWHFTVKNSSGTVIGNYVTDSTGIVLGVEVTAGNVHDSVAWDKVYDDVTHKHEVQFVTMDAGYKTPWIAKKTLDDGKVPVLPYTRYNGNQNRWIFYSSVQLDFTINLPGTVL